ncbi:MAG: hypothetical protein ONB48_04425 [candidate division KSB1 bacterium]|nr:hypothetical protein [candidate division KSB1 bacterium]MDZ7274444.1 hypothetical protein [candidate division KSB1 bacterium]MDZ7284894.1 hypothetical protein [candidate division KSB1 bacterium]MDZ7297685.1 hypothetical protein [candidate division KSB1 bacterium]MDZ7305891.1 hypothetical protein [candidate division KSB1 bacterium]
MTKSCAGAHTGTPARLLAVWPAPRKRFEACAITALRLMVMSVVLLLPGCQREPKNPLLDAAQFAEVYVGLLQAAELDSLTPAVADSILAAHGCDRRMLQAAAAHYRAHPELWQEVMNQAIPLLEEKVRAAQQRAHPDSSLTLPAIEPAVQGRQ